MGNTAGAFPDHDSCMAGLAKAYPDQKVRAKACRAAAGSRPRVEAAGIRLEGVRVSGTLTPGGSDAHVHDFTVETYEVRDEDGGLTQRRTFWCSPAYVPGTESSSPWEPGKPQALSVTHWHEWGTEDTVAEAAGHTHGLPDLPDSIAAEVERAERYEQQETASARVLEGEGFWIVRGLIAARPGVSKGQRLLKRRRVIEQTAELLDGAAIVYGHPDDGSLDVDRLQAPGVAIAGRFEDDAAKYDALLWATNPSGHSIPDADLERNRVFVDAVRSGKEIQNSLGTHSLEVARRGEAAPMGGGDPVPFDHEQVGLEGVAHIAILAPVVPRRASCPAPACGLPAVAVEVDAEALGVRREAVALAAARALRRAG